MSNDQNSKETRVDLPASGESGGVSPNYGLSNDDELFLVKIDRYIMAIISLASPGSHPTGAQPSLRFTSVFLDNSHLSGLFLSDVLIHLIKTTFKSCERLSLTDTPSNSWHARFVAQAQQFFADGERAKIPEQLPSECTLLGLLAAWAVLKPLPLSSSEPLLMAVLDLLGSASRLVPALETVRSFLLEGLTIMFPDTITIHNPDTWLPTSFCAQLMLKAGSGPRVIGTTAIPPRDDFGHISQQPCGEPKPADLVSLESSAILERRKVSYEPNVSLEQRLAGLRLLLASRAAAHNESAVIPVVRGILQALRSYSFITLDSLSVYLCIFRLLLPRVLCLDKLFADVIVGSVTPYFFAPAPLPPLVRSIVASVQQEASCGGSLLLNQLLRIRAGLLTGMKTTGVRAVISEGSVLSFALSDLCMSADSAGDTADLQCRLLHRWISLHTNSQPTLSSVRQLRERDPSAFQRLWEQISASIRDGERPETHCVEAAALLVAPSTTEARSVPRIDMPPLLLDAVHWTSSKIARLQCNAVPVCPGCGHTLALPRVELVSDTYRFHCSGCGFDVTPLMSGLADCLSPVGECPGALWDPVCAVLCAVTAHLRCCEEAGVTDIPPLTLITGDSISVASAVMGAVAWVNEQMARAAYPSLKIRLIPITRASQGDPVCAALLRPALDFKDTFPSDWDDFSRSLLQWGIETTCLVSRPFLPRPRLSVAIDDEKNSSISAFFEVKLTAQNPVDVTIEAETEGGHRSRVISSASLVVSLLSGGVNLFSITITVPKGDAICTICREAEVSCTSSLLVTTDQASAATARHIRFKALSPLTFIETMSPSILSHEQIHPMIFQFCIFRRVPVEQRTDDNNKANVCIFSLKRKYDDDTYSPSTLSNAQVDVVYDIVNLLETFLQNLVGQPGDYLRSFDVSSRRIHVYCSVSPIILVLVTDNKHAGSTYDELAYIYKNIFVPKVVLNPGIDRDRPTDSPGFIQAVREYLNTIDTARGHGVTFELI